jgi:hypothetical protein
MDTSHPEMRSACPLLVASPNSKKVDGYCMDMQSLKPCPHVQSDLETCNFRGGTYNG